MHPLLAGDNKLLTSIRQKGTFRLPLTCAWAATCRTRAQRFVEAVSCQGHLDVCKNGEDIEETACAWNFGINTHNMVTFLCVKPFDSWMRMSATLWMTSLTCHYISPILLHGCSSFYWWSHHVNLLMLYVNMLMQYFTDLLIIADNCWYLSNNRQGIWRSRQILSGRGRTCP